MHGDVGYYVVSHYSRFMTTKEKEAHAHLIATLKGTRGKGSDEKAQQEVRSHSARFDRWLSDDPEVLSLAKEGMEAFVTRVAERILAEHRDGVFLNYCPACGGLTCTPKARQCLHCGHDWHESKS